MLPDIFNPSGAASLGSGENWPAATGHFLAFLYQEEPVPALHGLQSGSRRTLLKWFVTTALFPPTDPDPVIGLPPFTDNSRPGKNPASR